MLKCQLQHLQQRRVHCRKRCSSIFMRTGLSPRKWHLTPKLCTLEFRSFKSMTKKRLHHTCFREKAQVWWLIRYLGDDGTCGGPKPHFGRKRWIETWYTSPRRCLEFSMRPLYCKTRELKVLQQFHWSELVLGQGVNCNIIMKLQ